MREGKRSQNRYFALSLRQRGDGGVVRLGLTATKKLGGAVVRNRARRRAREVFRQLLGEDRALAERDCDLALLFRSAAAEIDYQTFRQTLLQLLDKACIYKRREIPPQPV